MPLVAAGPLNAWGIMDFQACNHSFPPPELRVRFRILLFSGAIRLFEG